MPTASLIALRQLCRVHGHIVSSRTGTAAQRGRDVAPPQKTEQISVLAQPSGEALLHTTNLLCLLPREGKSSPSSGNDFNSVTLL